MEEVDAVALKYEQIMFYFMFLCENVVVYFPTCSTPFALAGSHHETWMELAVTARRRTLRGGLGAEKKGGKNVYFNYSQYGQKKLQVDNHHHQQQKQ